ncbi:MAG: DTW domain-containing protein [Cellvibrionaceae bacterium]
MDIEKTLSLWLKIPHRKFSRESAVENESITCDCSGFINLLFDQHNIPLPYQIDRPQAVHYFSVLQEIGSNRIDNIKEGHLFAWRKDQLPKKGDTGHVLVTRGLPVKIDEFTYRVPIIDSTKKENGLSQRNIELQTDKHGKIIGVRWHLDETKIKRTAIYHQSITESRYCFGCGLPRKVCRCGSIKPLLDIPPIIILRHPNERRRTLSTVSLIKQRYPNVLVKEGEIFSPVRASDLSLLFPDIGPNHFNPSNIINTKKTERQVDQAGSDKTKNFILIDATWRKSKKILHLNKWLKGLPKTTVKPTKVSNYLIRKVSSTEELSSIETFSWIMNDQALNRMFSDFIEHQITKMGKSTYDKNYKEMINYSKNTGQAVSTK